MKNEQDLGGCTHTVPAPADPGTMFPDEADHLTEINGLLEEALREAQVDVGRIDQEYMDAKRYMVQNRGEIDPHEMFQNELALKQIDSTGAFAANMWTKLVKTKDSPYFARIDFREGESREPAQYYIGRFSFSHRGELLIFDWRAPVAGMFYDCETGPAGYDAPSGRITGELIRKRQFQIRNGTLEYVLESSSQIHDDVLQRELSHTSDERMKSIIATIQKEQNRIIRNERTGTLLIQGVAGSGKTSVALHRVAYLLYRFQGRLTAEQVAILSPNRVFGDYIANVLPELGEEPIRESSFVQLALTYLKGVIGFEPDRDPLETYDQNWARRVRFKSTLEFVERTGQYLQQMVLQVFEPVDYSFGRFTANAKWIWERYCAYGRDPVKRRLEKVADDIYRRFDSENVMEDDLPKKKTILKSLHTMLRVKSSLDLYRDFYRWMGCPELFSMPQKKTLEWNDVFPFLYFHMAFEGLREEKGIRHLVVDEMQDYTPIQYAVLNILFRCPKTLLGDFGQLLNPNHLHTLDDIRRIYPDAEFAELTKSYRSTFEIMRFARRIRDVSRIEPVDRHGEEPILLKCRDGEDEMARIEAAIGAFEVGGYSSLGILAKTNQDAKALFDRLSPRCNAHLLTPESRRFENGVSVASIQMSKGLEFDEVLLADVSRDQYQNEFDRNLLYIACTRAMHRLTLLYTGERSPLFSE